MSHGDDLLIQYDRRIAMSLPRCCDRGGATGRRNWDFALPGRCHWWQDGDHKEVLAAEPTVVSYIWNRQRTLACRLSKAEVTWSRFTRWNRLRLGGLNQSRRDRREEPGDCLGRLPQIRGLHLCYARTLCGADDGVCLRCKTGGIPTPDDGFGFPDSRGR